MESTRPSRLHDGAFVHVCDAGPGGLSFPFGPGSKDGRHLPGSDHRDRPAGVGMDPSGRQARRVVNESGFILVTVLWLLVALGAVGLSAAMSYRTERLAAANLLDDARGREAASAGAEYARARLTAAMLDRAEELRAQTRSQQSRNGNQNRSRTQSVESLFRSADPIEDAWRDPQELVLDEMALGDARFTLRLRDTGAAFNLNEADEEMLRGFFSQGLELDYALADRIAQAILDWRDEDELPRVGGGEREEYLRAGAAILPANRPFATIDELRYVLGVTPEIFQAARPHLILISSGRINVNAAPEVVLLGIPGMTPAAAQEIVRLRESGTFPDDANSLLQSLSAGSAAPLRAMGRNFTARVSFRTSEVEILSEGGVVGSPVTSTLRVILTRTDNGAVVLAREYE